MVACEFQNSASRNYKREKIFSWETGLNFGSYDHDRNGVRSSSNEEKTGGKNRADFDSVCPVPRSLTGFGPSNPA